MEDRAKRKKEIDDKRAALQERRKRLRSKKESQDESNTTIASEYRKRLQDRKKSALDVKG